MSIDLLSRKKEFSDFLGIYTSNMVHCKLPLVYYSVGRLLKYTIISYLSWWDLVPGQYWISITLEFQSVFCILEYFLWDQFHTVSNWCMFDQYFKENSIETWIILNYGKHCTLIQSFLNGSPWIQSGSWSIFVFHIFIGL